MGNEPTREEIDILLQRAQELIYRKDNDWREVAELMDKLRAIVREAERRQADEG